MSLRSILLLLLWIAPLTAANGTVPPTFASSRNGPPTVSATTAHNTSATPNCTDLSGTTGATYPSCWNSLGMFEWMMNWNSSTTTCKPQEIWSSCFLRLAYGSAGYDCSTLGSLNCTAPRFGGPVTDPHIFYGAYNIYAINTYFLTWETALYALKSQPAIAQIAQLLGANGAPGLPRLTTSSLLSALLPKYGLDPAVDSALADILPVGPQATSLDTNATYYSTQLAQLLAQTLKDLMTDFLNGNFLYLAMGGQMMAYTGESEANLEASLAGTPVAQVATDANTESKGAQV
ncbi:hypothetical protein BDR22DRAFT_49925 [Usnea florida]